MTVQSSDVEQTALKARVERLLDLLREVEWAGEGATYDHEEEGSGQATTLPSCPVCDAFQRDGHEPNCRLREELWA